MMLFLLSEHLSDLGALTSVHCQVAYLVMEY